MSFRLLAGKAVISLQRRFALATRQWHPAGETRRRAAWTDPGAWAAPVVEFDDEVFGTE